MYFSRCPEMFGIVGRKMCPLAMIWAALCSVPSVKQLPWLPEGFVSLVVSQDRSRKRIKEEIHRLFSNETISFMYHNLTEKVLLGCFIYAHIYIYICIKKYRRNFCFWLNIYWYSMSGFSPTIFQAKRPCRITAFYTSVNSCWIKKLCDPLEWNTSTPPQSALFIFPLFPCLIHYLFSFSQCCHTQE